MVGECKGAACTHLHFTVFTTEIYFMGLLVSHQGTGRKCLLPERKSLKLWEIIKLANTVGSADLRGQLLWQSGNRMGTVMWRCKQSYSHWTFYCPDTAECGKHETKMLYVLYLEQYFKCFSPFFCLSQGLRDTTVRTMWTTVLVISVWMEEYVWMESIPIIVNVPQNGQVDISIVFLTFKWWFLLNLYKYNFIYLSYTVLKQTN